MAFYYQDSPVCRFFEPLSSLSLAMQVVKCYM